MGDHVVHLAGDPHPLLLRGLLFTQPLFTQHVLHPPLGAVTGSRRRSSNATVATT